MSEKTYVPQIKEKETTASLKKPYEKPMIIVEDFEQEDIITSSVATGDNDTEINW